MSGPVPNDPAERTVAALTSLADALRATGRDLDRLVQRAEALAEQVVSGVPLTEAMAQEDRPLIITTLVAITDRLHEVGGEVRRAEAQQLRAEGRTHDQIAALFAVTRQRVAQLLAGGAVKSPIKRGR